MFVVVGHTVRPVLFTPGAMAGLSEVWLVGDPAGGSGAGVGPLAEFYSNGVAVAFEPSVYANIVMFTG